MNCDPKTALIVDNTSTWASIQKAGKDYINYEHILHKVNGRAPIRKAIFFSVMHENSEGYCPERKLCDHLKSRQWIVHEKYDYANQQSSGYSKIHQDIEIAFECERQSHFHELIYFVTANPNHETIIKKMHDNGARVVVINTGVPILNNAADSRKNLLDDYDLKKSLIRPES